MPEIEMQPVQSQAIAERGYDPESLTLRVRFTPNRTNPAGAVYDYEGVPKYIWDQFLAAESAGRFWSARIKSVFQARRVA